MEGYPRGPEQGYYQKPPNGTLILVFGILSLVICMPAGVVPWVMGNQAIREIKAGIMDPREEGLVQGGRICGMVAAILFILVVVFYCGIFGLIFGLGAAGAAGSR